MLTETLWRHACRKVWSKLVGEEHSRKFGEENRGAVVQRVRILVREQDVVMMKEEGSSSATVVSTCMVKIEGCGIVPAALSPSERAGSCATSIAPIHRAGLERVPNTHTTPQS